MKTVSLLNLATKALPPLWWSSMGDVVWKSQTSTQYSLRLNTGRTQSKASGQIRISKGRFKDLWEIEWHLFLKTGNIKGKVIFKTAELLMAFGMSCEDFAPVRSVMFCEQHGAEAGVQGRFIRQGVYLNIPCPKAELVGDPNFSLKISPYVFAKVQAFVEKHL